MKLFYEEVFTFLMRRAIETTKRRNSRSKQKMIVYGPEPFLNDCRRQIKRFEQVSSFVVCRFVVSMFRRFAIETKEQVYFSFFESETRPAMIPTIATIAIATRLIQPECAFETNTSANYLYDGSRDGDPGMTKKASA